MEANLFAGQLPFARGASWEQGELEQIRQLGVSTDLLCRWVLERLSVHPGDARAAPALALAVNAAGHHEGDAQTAELSQACFDLLHSRYAGTPWAAQKPRAYKGICGKDGEACP